VAEGETPEAKVDETMVLVVRLLLERSAISEGESEASEV
jgi:hypothetical protein